MCVLGPSRAMTDGVQTEEGTNDSTTEVYTRGPPPGHDSPRSSSDHRLHARLDERALHALHAR